MNNMNTTIPFNAMNNPLMFNNNFGYNNTINNNIPVNQIQNNTFPITNLNLLENSYQPVSPSNQTLNNAPAMRQIYKNDEITVYVTLNSSPDKTQLNGAFYVSNNVSKSLNNVKLNLSVKKHVICKVLSTSATSMEPLKSLGIKKVNKNILFNFLLF
jgi:hypothetical protein